MATSSAVSPGKSVISSEIKSDSRDRQGQQDEERKSDSEEKYDDRRLWMGNLDPKLTDFLFFNYGFQLLKLVQRFGSIENFDFLFHRSGPNAGLPRGYAFITFKTPETAQKCLNGLNGKKILERTISIRYAHQTSYVFTDEEEKLWRKLPALGKLEAEAPASKERTISAIEAKLRAMERDRKEQDDFSLTSVSGNINMTKAVTKSSAIHYNYGKASNQHNYDVRTRSKPYSRNYPKKRY